MMSRSSSKDVFRVAKSRSKKRYAAKKIPGGYLLQEKVAAGKSVNRFVLKPLKKGYAIKELGGYGRGSDTYWVLETGVASYVVTDMDNNHANGFAVRDVGSSYVMKCF